ncbi:MAG: DUF1963 domain-containing protein [Planctomycetes bacterium]|nr:DUF1963 domain-containing protein [Planctomycetota bacterium]
MNTVEKAYKELDQHLRTAAIAQIGGFRPPENRMTSWFGGSGVGLKNDETPTYNGQEMFQLLQIKVSELPYIPPQLVDTAFITVFFNRQEIPFDKECGDGWIIREYKTMDGLELLENSDLPTVVKDFPIKWNKVDDDAPSWEDAWEFVDLDPINEEEGADEKFFNEYNRYAGSKVGGYPYCIQHGAYSNSFVFQIGSEEKSRWMWADNGTAYFYKSENGIWSFSCQFY